MLYNKVATIVLHYMKLIRGETNHLLKFFWFFRISTSGIDRFFFSFPLETDARLIWFSLFFFFLFLLKIINATAREKGKKKKTFWGYGNIQPAHQTISPNQTELTENSPLIKNCLWRRTKYGLYCNDMISIIVLLHSHNLIFISGIDLNKKKNSEEGEEEDVRKKKDLITVWTQSNIK